MMRRGDAEIAHSLEPSNTVRLLPSFDCYVMFFSPRDSFVLGENRERIFRKEAGWVFPSLIINGKAAGVWALRKRSKSVIVELERFRPLNGNEIQAVNQANRSRPPRWSHHVERSSGC